MAGTNAGLIRDKDNDFPHFHLALFCFFLFPWLFFLPLTHFPKSLTHKCQNLW